MKQLFLLLSVLVTIIATGQGFAPSTPNPDPNKYPFETLNDALNSGVVEGQHFKVKQKISDFIYLNEYVVRRKSEGWTVNGGTVQAMRDTNFVAVVNMANAQAINVSWFGADGDINNDNTAALKAIRNYSNISTNLLCVFIPNGIYTVTDSLPFRKGLRIVGENPVTTKIRRLFSSTDHGSLGAITFLSASPSEKITGISVENLGFISYSDSLGHDQWGHQLCFMGTDGASATNCIFEQPRGDGIYAGAGLTGAPEDYRYNSNITINRCSFDGGANFNNRNAISLIDVDLFSVTNCYFKRIGNNVLSRSVGCIDYERNRNSAYTRQGTIFNCRFENCMSINTSAVTAFMTTIPDIHDNANMISVDKCLFDSTYWGVSINTYTDYPGIAGENSQVSVTNSEFLYNHIALRASGNFMNITHNYFKGNATQYSHVQLGFLGGGRDLEAQNVDFGFNVMDSCGQNGAVELSNVRYATFHNNHIMDRRSAFYFYADNISNLDRKLDHLKFIDNYISAPSFADVNSSSLYMYNAPTGFNLNNLFINGNCEERGNVLDNRVGRATGVELYMNGSIITKAPTKGSWDMGNELRTNSGANGNYRLICTQGGTFGVDTATDGSTIHHSFLAKYFSNKLTVTNSENLFKSHLREGQYLKLDSSTLVYKIQSIPDTATIFLDQVYNYFNGVDSSHTTDATWIAPQFSSVPTNYAYNIIGATTHKKVGSTSQFWENYNIINDSIYIDTDSTTALDTRLHIRNINPFNNSVTIIPDIANGMKINFSSLPIVLHKNDEIDLIYKGNNTYRIWDNNTAEKFNYLPNNDTAITYSKGNVFISPSTTVLPPPNALLNINVNQRLFSTPALMLANSNSGLLTGVQQNWRLGYDSNYITGQFEHITDSLGYRDMRIKVSSGVDSLFNLMTLAGYGSVSIGKNYYYPDNSALLDLNSTSKGFLKPRMTTTQGNNIVAKRNGLEIFNTSINRPAFYDSTNAAWKYVEDTVHAKASYMALSPTSVTIQANTAAGISTLLTLKTIGNGASNRGNQMTFETPLLGASMQSGAVGSAWDGTATRGVLYFSAGDNNNALSEKARINSAGQFMLNTTAPATASTIFQVESGTMGSLPAPRVTSTQNNAIGTLTGGLLVFNRDKQIYRHYDSLTGKWVSLLKTDTTDIANGMLPIGDAANKTFKRANITGANDITVTNTAGGISIGTTLLLGAKTTAQRDALSPTAGQQIFNTDNGYYEYYSGTFWGWLPYGSNLEWERKYGFTYNRTFFNTNNDAILSMVTTNSGAVNGSQGPTGATAESSGSVAFNLPTATNATAGCISNSAAMVLGSGATVYETRVYVPTLSNSTDRFVFIAGLFDNVTGINQTDGVYFLYDEGGVSTGSTASPNWEIVTSSNSSRTFADASVTVTAATWYTLREEINTAGTNVDYYINGTKVATSLTTTIPTGLTRALGFGEVAVKSAGTTQRGVVSNYIYLKQKYSTPRP